jgi:ABC-type multidrug transport system ATPase subunit
MTTRDIEEAKQFCDKVAIIVNGRIVCYGTPDYLIKSYGSG